MSGTHAPAARCEVVEQDLCGVEAQPVRLAVAHDPMGHLLTIERLARAARAEWQDEQRQSKRGRRNR